MLIVVYKKLTFHVNRCLTRLPEEERGEREGEKKRRGARLSISVLDWDSFTMAYSQDSLFS